MNFAAQMYIIIDFDETPPRKFITTGQLTFLVDLYLGLYGQFSYKTSLELLLENSTESVILTIDEKKNELCSSKSILLSISMKRHHVDSLLLVN